MPRRTASQGEVFSRPVMLRNGSEAAPEDMTTYLVHNYHQQMAEYYVKFSPYAEVILKQQVGRVPASSESQSSAGVSRTGSGLDSGVDSFGFM
jgi:hypothetical protein